MSNLNSLTRSFQLRLTQNIPSGYAIDDIYNLDRGVSGSTDKKHLTQSTALGLRQFTAPDVKRCIRQFFIHTIAIYVPNSNRTQRAGILTTASEIQALFEHIEFDEYKTQVAEIDIVGKQTDSKFYRVDININGYFEEIL